MSNQKPTGKINLDWSKLLGFDQATRVEDKAEDVQKRVLSLAKVGGKVGSKPGVKLGLNL